MSRLIQIIQNTFIRIFALTKVILGTIFGFIGNIFGSFARSLGLRQSEYYLESDAAKSLKKNLAQLEVKPESPKQTVTPKTNQRIRKNDPNMDYFRNMAKQIQDS